MKINPMEIKGPWDQGYVLDIHTISSTLIGYNEFGHAEFDTLRSELGELLFRLKYRGDKGAIPLISETLAEFVMKWGICPELIVPMPPSKLQRSVQPVIEIAENVAKHLNLPVSATSLRKTGATPQMKDVGDFPARLLALEKSLRAIIHSRESACCYLMICINPVPL